MRKSCIECGDTFVGRADKKFCSSDCRSKFHHKKKKPSSLKMRSINRILSKNRQILSEIKSEGNKSIHREILLESGFSFQYCTHVNVTRRGTIKKFCYDVGYYGRNDRVFLC